MPRNPHASSATHPDTYGSGLRQGTAAYYKAIDDYLEMYGKDFGAPYDPSEDAPNWQDAAAASGLSQKSYADCYREMRRQGRVK